MQHFRSIIAGTSPGDGMRADQSRKADGAEIQHHGLVGSELPVIFRKVRPQQLAVEFVTAVHRARIIPFPLPHAGVIRLCWLVGQTKDGN